MNQLSGPRLERLKDELKTWAVEQKLKYREWLTKDYPLGAQRITPDEQIMRFLEMQGQDYEQLVLALNTKYLGHPHAYDMVNQELAKFLYTMVGHALRLSGDTGVEEDE